MVCVLPRRTWGTCNKSLLRIICKYNSTLTPFQCTETWFVHKNGSRNGITETNPLDSPFLPQHPVYYSTGCHVDYPKALTVETCHGCTVPNDALKKPFNPCLDMSRTIYLQHFSSMKRSSLGFSLLRAVLFKAMFQFVIALTCSSFLI